MIRDVRQPSSAVFLSSGATRGTGLGEGDGGSIYCIRSIFWAALRCGRRVGLRAGRRARARAPRRGAARVSRCEPECSVCSVLCAPWSNGVAAVGSSSAGLCVRMCRCDQTQCEIAFHHRTKLPCSAAHGFPELPSNLADPVGFNRRSRYRARWLNPDDVCPRAPRRTGRCRRSLLCQHPDVSTNLLPSFLQQLGM